MYLLALGIFFVWALMFTSGININLVQVVNPIPPSFRHLKGNYRNAIDWKAILSKYVVKHEEMLANPFLDKYLGTCRL